MPSADYRFVWKDKIFNIGISIGLVEISHVSGTLQDVMSAADSACYVAKQEGRGKVHIYSARDEAIARERGDIQWLRELQSALHDGGFELAVQPIIAMQQYGVESGPSLEVLIRLPDERGRHYRHRPISCGPAERYQLMPQIDRWVVNATLSAIAGGEIKLAGRRSCAINLSGQTIADESFLGFVVDALDRSGVALARYAFEVTEKAILSQTCSTRNASSRCCTVSAASSRWTISAAGWARSPASSICPSTTSRSTAVYTRNVQTDEVNQEMVAAMIKLARTMEFRVVAEQVEQQEDFDWLRERRHRLRSGPLHRIARHSRHGGTSGPYRTLTVGT